MSALYNARHSDVERIPQTMVIQRWKESESFVPVNVGNETLFGGFDVFDSTSLSRIDSIVLFMDVISSVLEVEAGGDLVAGGLV